MQSPLFRGGESARRLRMPACHRPTRIRSPAPVSAAAVCDDSLEPCAGGRQAQLAAIRPPHWPTLCETYWYPLYAYVRRRGHDADDAQDLTQAFFARLLEKNDLAAAQQERGKFRSFLLTSLKHFLANEWDRGRAQKRGGGRHAAFDRLRSRRRPLPPRAEPRTDRREDLRAALGAGPARQRAGSAT